MRKMIACCLVAAGFSLLMLASRALAEDDSDPKRWCFSWYATKPEADENERAALLKSAKWNSGDVITVSFLDGDPGLRAKVRQAAQQWTVPGKTANLRLSFPQGTTKTLIRISFRFSGSWSVLGTTCKQVPANQPTMNFGWLTPSSTDTEIQEVVLHEFGHALGLIHEHQNPAGGIKWNKPAVYKDLSGPPNNWDKPTIDSNMFRPYSARETNFTKLDPSSIMMYSFPASWTLNGFSTRPNTKLSPTDVAFIRRQYP
jgi:serralysin